MAARKKMSISGTQKETKERAHGSQKIPDKNSLRKGGLVSVHTLRKQKTVIVAEKPWQLEPEAAGHTAFVVRRHGAMKAVLAHFLLFILSGPPTPGTGLSTFRGGSFHLN